MPKGFNLRIIKYQIRALYGTLYYHPTILHYFIANIISFAITLNYCAISENYPFLETNYLLTQVDIYLPHYKKFESFLQLHDNIIIAYDFKWNWIGLFKS